MPDAKQGWSKKRKGIAKIYTHPDAFEGRAIVVSPFGISFNGRRFETFEEAASIALHKQKGHV